MANVNIKSIKVPLLDLEEIDGEDSLAGKLAWEFCNKLRQGETPSKSDFSNRLPNRQSKEEFEFLVSMNEFVEYAAESRIDSDVE